MSGGTINTELLGNLAGPALTRMNPAALLVYGEIYLHPLPQRAHERPQRPSQTGPHCPEFRSDQHHWVRDAQSGRRDHGSAFAATRPDRRDWVPGAADRHRVLRRSARPRRNDTGAAQAVVGVGGDQHPVRKVGVGCRSATCRFMRPGRRRSMLRRPPLRPSRSTPPRSCSNFDVRDEAVLGHGRYRACRRRVEHPARQPAGAPARRRGPANGDRSG